MALKNTLAMVKLEINGLYGDRNGQMEGMQSLKNKKTYVLYYSEKIGDFVGKWVHTPDFVKRSLSIKDTSDNIHDEH